jgi:hypothetical protein
MIQPPDLKRFKELITKSYRKNGETFETDEIRIESGLISIWDLGKEQWYYLNKNLDWVSDSEDEDIFRF